MKRKERNIAEADCLQSSGAAARGYQRSVRFPPQLNPAIAYNARQGLGISHCISTFNIPIRAVIFLYPFKSDVGS